LPNFYNDDIGVPLTFHGQKFPYYDQWQFYQWQMNQDKSYIFDGYALQAKEFLIETFNALTTANNDSMPLTMQMLNGQDSNGVTCCNPETKNRTVDASCVQTPQCVQDYLSWQDFYANYWSPQNETGIQDVFVNNRYDDPVYENRFCEFDYFNSYQAPQKNQPPPYSNYDEEKFVNGKFKTFKNSVFSIFPMEMAARTTAHAKAQTAYVVAAVVMQMCNLLVVRTRTASIFQHGMANTFLNYALLFEIMLMAFFVYIPIAWNILGTRPLDFVHWTPAFPYAIVAFIGHELRKMYTRNDVKKEKWLTRATYW